MASVVLTIDPNKKLQTNVVSRSPHVVAYRFWCRRPGSGWETIANGDTEDNVPDYAETGLFAGGDEIACEMALGGNPNTKYRTIVTFGQDGRVLENGTFIQEGSTNPKGLAWISIRTKLTV